MSKNTLAPGDNRENNPLTPASLGERELNSNEKEEIKKIYDLLDTNGDNKVSPSELYRGAQLLGMNPTREEAKELIKQCDTDENGFLGYKEFEEFMKRMILQIEFERDNLERAFRVFDKDKSGYLDREQLANALRGHGEKLTPEEEEEFFSLADTDGNGKITVDEFVNLFSTT